MLPGFAPDNCQNPVARSVSNSLETFNISNYLDNISVTSINPFKIPKTQKQCFKTNFKKQTSVQPHQICSYLQDTVTRLLLTKTYSPTFGQIHCTTFFELTQVVNIMLIRHLNLELRVIWSPLRGWFQGQTLYQILLPSLISTHGQLGVATTENPSNDHVVIVFDIHLFIKVDQAN